MVMPPPKKITLQASQWAALDDACWLVFRLFGVNIRPRFAGIPGIDRPWSSQFPWICQELHDPSSYAGEKPARQPRACILDNPDRTDLPRTGRCVSGLFFRTVRMPAESGFKGCLVLGPYLKKKPTESDIGEFQARTGIPATETIRWSILQSPVLPPSREKQLVGFCLRLFTELGRNMGRIAEASAQVFSGKRYEPVFPPLRLADDYPLHIFGVFLTYWKGPPGGTEAPPSKTCDLEYIDRGKCRIESANSSFILEQGQAILILPGQQIRMLPAQGEPVCDAISVTFHANASLLAPLEGKPITFNPFQQALFSRLCAVAVPRDDRSHRDSSVKLLLAQILLSLREEPPPPGIAADLALPANRRTRRTAAANALKNYIDNSPGRPFDLGELARITRLSVPTVLRIFRKETGTTPGKYHHLARIRQAELLLRQSMLTVGQIGEQLGFSSQFHFSSAFKKATGLSPSDFARTSRSTLQQVERAKALLTEKRMSVPDAAGFLGFSTVEEFRRAFRHYAGTDPEDYARGNKGPEIGGS
jgi:AraC-like DNA-binding protein